MKRLVGLGILVLALFGLAQRVAASNLLQGDTVTITMKDFAFDPQNITIHAGASVVWQNAGAKKHTATADDNSFDTAVVAPGSSSQPIKFDKPGTYLYYCQFHGGPGGTDMAGTITVVADNGNTDTAQATTAPTAAPAAKVAPVGSAVFADKAKGAHADKLTIALSNIPLPEEGQQYEAFLASATNRISLGKINLKADGTATVEYADPAGHNLIDSFNMVLISSQSGIAYSGQIPPQAYVHVKHVMSQFPDTPEKVGLLTGAIDQEAVLTQHVQFMNDAIKAGNLALAKTHLEHIHNIMTGNNGAKDLNGDGKLTVVPPGDGFGIFNYLTVAAQHADLAAKQPDASDNIKVKANHVKVTAGNASTTLTQMQTLLVQAAAAKSIAEIKPLTDQITKLNDAVNKGLPDASGGVSPTKGSGGLGTAYAEGLAMAAISILPGDVTGGKGTAGTGTSSPATQTAPTAAAADPNVTTVVMKEFEFSQPTITIKAGTAVIFANQGTKKHTATADDNSFDTAVVAPGSSAQPLKFDKPGTYPYYCQFHGGPGGTAMSGVIVVQ